METERRPGRVRSLMDRAVVTAMGLMHPAIGIHLSRGGRLRGRNGEFAELRPWTRPAAGLFVAIGLAALVIATWPMAWRFIMEDRGGRRDL